MPPRNLLAAMALGALATLAHPFVFIRRFAGPRHFVPRSKLDTGRWSPELLKRLEWRRFEELCAAYFEALGFRAELAGADGGGAIDLYEQGSASVSILVQCSPWNAYRVGVKPVRGLLRAMRSRNVGEGVLVTPGRFTQEARDLAGKQQVSLIDGDELLAKITALLPEKALALLELATRGDFLTPTCPSCGIKMIPRKSTAHGRTYWGCRNYPGCKHTLFEAS